MDFDTLLNKIGGFGLYQRMVYFTLGAYAIATVFHTLGIVFIAAAPDHVCAIPGIEGLNLTETTRNDVSIPLEEKGGVWVYSSCRMYDRNYSGWTQEDMERHLANPTRVNNSVVECTHGWIYDQSNYMSTVVTQWDLVCSNQWLQPLTVSTYMAGMVFGAILFGSLADLVGRYPSMIVSLVLTLSLGVAVALSPSFCAFLVMRFFLGAGNIGLFTSSFVLAMEVTGPSWRMHCGIAYMYFWAFGHMLYAGMAYAVRDWWKLQLYTSLPLAFLMYTLAVTHESPRWLYLDKNTKRAERTLRKIAKTNLMRLPDTLNIVIKRERKGFLWDLFRTPRLRLRTLNLLFNWFVNTAVYYGISLSTSNFGGNAFVIFFISGAVEVPAYLFCQFLLSFVGRRVPLSLAMIIAGLALLCTLAVPPRLSTVSVVLAMLAKFCISASFAIAYVFTAELYPTSVRNIAVSTGSLLGRSGAVVAPYIGYMGKLGGDTNVIPYVVYGVLCVLAGLSALFLPETKDQPLPQTFHEAENIGREEREIHGIPDIRNGHVTRDTDIRLSSS